MKSLSAFIRAYKDRIIDEWVVAASQLPSATHLSLPAIRDHVPDILDSLAEAVNHDDAAAQPLHGLPNLHAAIRVREGYDLRQVIAEYRILRRVILELYAQSGDLSAEVRPTLVPIRHLSGAIDHAIGDAVDQFALDRDKSREMFIGMLGHDLREPLNTIAFSARMLWERGEHVDAQTLKTAARIGASAKRMETMIRDLLDFARGRLGGGLPIVPTATDARALMLTTVGDIADARPERDIRCYAERAHGDFHVEWDSDRIVQAISNLVGNAIAHGGDPIVVEPFDRGSEIAIEVRNRGEIPPSVMPRLFEPFSPPATERRHEQVPHRGPDRRHPHLGLGLYIVREICQAHGGRVEAASPEGEAIFRMILPRRARATTSRQPGGPERRGGAGVDRRKASRTDRRRSDRPAIAADAAVTK